MKCLSSCIILLILTLNTEAQPKYTKQQLIEDLKVFKDILVNTNPIFEDAGRDSMEKKFSQAIRSFPMDSATGLEFIQYVPALKAKTGYDDHANIMLDGKLFPATASFFPIPVYLIQDSLLVNTEKGPIPFGSMIESINGIKVREILKELAGNGQKDNFRKYRLNTAFPFLLFLKYGAKDTFTIAYKTDIDEVSEKKISCAAIGIDELPRAQSTSVFPLNRDVFTGKMNINTQFDEVSKLYYMQVPSFGVFSADSMTTYQQFKNAFDSLFKEIRLKSAACLVIDIRGNGGGLMDIPGLLFSYLADSVFYEAQYLKMQPVKNIPLRYLKAIDKKHITSIIDAKKRLYRLYDGFTTNKGKSKKTVLYKREPGQYSFRGEVILLADGGTFSAAAYFAALFRQHQRGHIIGSPIGGSIKEMTAGHLLQYELPNTGIRLTIPLTHITFDKELYPTVREEYISPDYTIPFKSEYQYFLKKQDWGRGLNTNPKN